VASGTKSFAGGSLSNADGLFSMAFGQGAKAYGNESYAFGDNVEANGIGSFVVGSGKSEHIIAMSPSILPQKDIEENLSLILFITPEQTILLIVNFLQLTTRCMKCLFNTCFLVYKCNKVSFNYIIF